MKTKTILFSVLLTFAGAAAAQSGNSLDPKDEALLQAAFDGDLALVESVVAKGANVEVTGPKSRTSTIWAAANGHTAIVKFLHGQGADIDAKDSGGQTPLMFAVKGSHRDTVEYLLENGADVNARSKKRGFTALITAAAVGDVEVVRLLLEHGADKSVVELGGHTALDRARQYEHPDVATLLEGEEEAASGS